MEETDAIRLRIILGILTQLQTIELPMVMLSYRLLRLCRLLTVNTRAYGVMLEAGLLLCDD